MNKKKTAGVENTKLDVFRTKILEYFSAAPLAHAVKTLEIASGTVESRRVAEHFPEASAITTNADREQAAAYIERYMRDEIEFECESLSAMLKSCGVCFSPSHHRRQMELSLLNRKAALLK